MTTGERLTDDQLVRRLLQQTKKMKPTEVARALGKPRLRQTITNWRQKAEDGTEINIRGADTRARVERYLVTARGKEYAEGMRDAIQEIRRSLKHIERRIAVDGVADLGKDDFDPEEN